MRSTLLVATLFLAALLLNGCITINAFGGPSDVRVLTLERGSPLYGNKIAIVPVDGVITGGGEGDGFFSRDSSVIDLARKLDAAKSDSSIKALILRVDSPGGGVTASDIMLRKIQQYKEETGNPVYVSMQSLAASGGYYIAMAGDEVYANPTTVTGSIGVIIAIPNVAGLMDRFGIRMNAITTGEMKDAGAFYKDMTPADRAVFQGLVDDMHEKFVAVIAKGRPDLEEARIRELADGRVYTADQAAEAGLIDGVLYLDEVIEKVREDLNPNRRETVVLITRTARTSVESPYAQVPASADAFPSVRLDPSHPRTGEMFNYLWMP